MRLLRGWCCLLLVAGCAGERSSGPEPPAAGEAPLEWTAPASGDSLADTIRVRIRQRGSGLGSVRLMVDSVVVAESSAPPWVLDYHPRNLAPRRLGLRLLADEGTPGAWLSERREILWSPNAPPSVRILASGAGPYVDRASGDSLRAVATDPEDGVLHDDSVVWISSIQGIVGSGERLPIDALIDGDHRLRVRGTDRWQRSGWDQTELTVFEYQGARSPAGALTDLLHAWNARAPERAVELLAPGFRFLFCEDDRAGDPEMPERWERDEEAAFLSRILPHPRIASFRLTWNLSAPQDAWVDGQRWAKVEITGLSLAVSWLEGEGLSVRGGAARVYLAEEAPGLWRIQLWRDLGASSELSQGGLRVLLGQLTDRAAVSP